MDRQPDHIDAACKPDNFLTCLTRGDTAGLTLQIAASLLSLGAVLYTFAFIVNVNQQNAGRRHPSKTRFRIFYNSMDLFIFSLLCADFVQAVGGLLSLRWIQSGIVKVGAFCDAQGILKVFGETGVALSTLLIAVSTFVGVSTGRNIESVRITAVIVGVMWIFIGILVVVGDTTNTSFMSPAPYWCWVSRDYLAWRIVCEYLWLWVTLLVSFLLYTPLYLWMRGNLVFDESGWSFRRASSEPDRRSTRRKALVMLMYPIVYCVCVIPLSIVRWITFMDEANFGDSTMSSVATFTVITIFNLSGFFNVVLVFTTKPKLGLFGQQSCPTLGRPMLDSEAEATGIPLRLPPQLGPANNSGRLL